MTVKELIEIENLENHISSYGDDSICFIDVPEGIVDAYLDILDKQGFIYEIEHESYDITDIIPNLKSIFIRFVIDDNNNIRINEKLKDQWIKLTQKSCLKSAQN